jgi:predicted CXXCH cytochrome family protein
MKYLVQTKANYFPLLVGTLVGVLAMLIFIGAAYAAPVTQENAHPSTSNDRNCKDCHLDITNLWSPSAHANAYHDPVFQERWLGLGNPGECLVCHTTNYQATTGQFSYPGVSCEACHGTALADHPPAMVPIHDDAQYCGQCHTTTLQEWRLSGHFTVGVGCMDCHDPHSQQALFADPDNMCINCHRDAMDDYLEDLHIQRGIGCVDCHTLVIPPDPVPIDGIVPTGHSFEITPATCVACHTDALHAGFSLPGWEYGASVGLNNNLVDELRHPSQDELVFYDVITIETGLTPEQQIQKLEAALASSRLATLFQGGVIGLVLGGTTAWFVAHNARRRLHSGEHQEEAAKKESENG